MGELALIAIIALAVLVQTNKDRPPSKAAVLSAAFTCAVVAEYCHRQAKRARSLPDAP